MKESQVVLHASKAKNSRLQTKRHPKSCVDLSSKEKLRLPCENHRLESRARRTRSSKKPSVALLQACMQSCQRKLFFALGRSLDRSRIGPKMVKKCEKMSQIGQKMIKKWLKLPQVDQSWEDSAALVPGAFWPKASGPDIGWLGACLRFETRLLVGLKNFPKPLKQEKTQKKTRQIHACVASLWGRCAWTSFVFRSTYREFTCKHSWVAYLNSHRWGGGAAAVSRSSYRPIIHDKSMLTCLCGFSLRPVRMNLFCFSFHISRIHLQTQLSGLFK